MAIDSLDQRLNQLGAVQAESDVSPLTAEVPVANPTDLVSLTEEPQSFEPVQVAGFIGTLKNVIASPVRKEVKILKKGEEAGKVGPYQVINETEAAAKSQQILQQAPTAPISGRPSPTPTQAASGVEETVFNLDRISGPDELKQFIESTSRVYGADKIETISYKSLADEMSKLGYDEAFVARILDITTSTQADPKYAFKMLLALTDAGDRAFKLGNDVVAAKKAGMLTDELATEFQQAVALEGALTKSVKGRQADIARTLGVFSQVRSPSPERGAALSALLKETGGIDSVHDFAGKYISLDSRSSRAQMAAAGYSDDLTGIYERTRDIWFSTWINGILSAPITHGKNILSGTFQLYGLAENSIAAGIGSVRRGVFRSTEESIGVDELTSRAYGFLRGIKEGAVLGANAFAKNTPTDPLSKLETGRYGRDPFEVDLGDNIVGKSFANALKYYGNVITLPGRALMAEDEFFKGVAFRVELNGLAAREATRKFRELVDANVNPAQARQIADSLMASTLSDPSDDIVKAATQAARTMTFTKDLPESLQFAQAAARNNFVKMFIPFVRTPTNIMLEAGQRSPLALLSPQFYSDMAAGGVRQDMAIAKVTLGGGVVYAAGSMALDGQITGYGPLRLEDRNAMIATGWQPFSFVFSKDNMSPEMIERFSKISKVSVGEKNVYVSYAGVEPVATLLGVAATAGEYSTLSAGQFDMEKIMSGAALGMYKTIAEYPMLQGFNDMMKITESRAQDVPSLMYDLMFKASKQMSSFAIGGSPLGAYSSMLNAVERAMSPEKSNLRPEEALTKHEITDGALQGFWAAVRQAKSRNQLTSDDLPRELDSITGDEKKPSEGGLWDALNPLKVSEGKYSPGHTTLIKYGVPAYHPPNMMDGVTLSATQWNRWVEIATDKGNLERRITRLGSALEGMAAVNLEQAQITLQQTISDAYSEAKQRLLIEDRSLAQAIKEVKAPKAQEGKFKY